MSMNNVQRTYAEAKIRKDTITEACTRSEDAYVATMNIRNPETGKIVTRMYDITWDDNLFDRLNTDWGDLHKDLCEEYTAAHKAFRKAEDALIAYGISVAPEEIRETLAKVVSGNYKAREKFLDLTFRLDPDSVKAI